MRRTSGRASPAALRRARARRRSLPGASYAEKDGTFTATDRRVLSAIRQERPRQIVLVILQEPGIDHKAIQAETGVGASSLSFYMKDLIEKEVVEKLVRIIATVRVLYTR